MDILRIIELGALLFSEVWRVTIKEDKVYQKSGKIKGKQKARNITNLTLSFCKMDHLAWGNFNQQISEVEADLSLLNRIRTKTECTCTMGLSKSSFYRINEIHSYF